MQLLNILVRSSLAVSTGVAAFCGYLLWKLGVPHCSNNLVQLLSFHLQLHSIEGTLSCNSLGSVQCKSGKSWQAGLSRNVVKVLLLCEQQAANGVNVVLQFCVPAHDNLVNQVVLKIVWSATSVDIIARLSWKTKRHELQTAHSRRLYPAIYPLFNSNYNQ